MLRWQGLIDYVHEKNLPYDVSYLVEVRDEEEAYAFTKGTLLEQKEVCGIFLSTAFGNYGVGSALLEGKREDLVVVGNDFLSPWKKFLEKDVIRCFLYQYPYLQGFIAVVVLCRFLVFGVVPLEKTFYLPVFSIFPEHLKDDVEAFEVAIARHLFVLDLRAQELGITVRAKEGRWPT